MTAYMLELFIKRQAAVA